MVNEPMFTPADKRVENCQFHAFLRDEQNIVRLAFSRRIEAAQPDDDLTIKLVEDRSDRPTYDIFRRNIRSDMDSDEQCRITLLPYPEMESNTADSTLKIEPAETTWFTEAANVSVREKDGMEKPLGILLMVNPENVHLIKNNLHTGETTEQQEENIFQLLEMLPATYRQHHLYRHYGIKGLPGPTVDADRAPYQWPLLNSLGEKYVTQGFGLTGSGLPGSGLPGADLLKQVMEDISNLTGTIAAMHEQGVAHGDIRLKSLRIIDGRLGPGNAERFSVTGACPGPRHPGEKRFTFYNNAWHAPELRFPGAYAGTGAGFAPWQYTPASKEGDIWSFGLLLAMMICHIQGGEEALYKAGVLQQSLADYMKSSDVYCANEVDRAVANEAAEIQKAGYGTPYLSEPKGLLKLNLPTGANCFSEPVGTALSNSDKKKLCQLVALVERCTHIDPKQRPSAKSVFEELDAIMGKQKNQLPWHWG